MFTKGETLLSDGICALERHEHNDNREKQYPQLGIVRKGGPKLSVNIFSVCMINRCDIPLTVAVPAPSFKREACHLLHKPRAESPDHGKAMVYVWFVKSSSDVD